MGSGSNSLDFDGAVCIICVTSSSEWLLKLVMDWITSNRHILTAIAIRISKVVSDVFILVIKKLPKSSAPLMGDDLCILRQYLL